MAYVQLLCRFSGLWQERLGALILRAILALAALLICTLPTGLGLLVNIGGLPLRQIALVLIVVGSRHNANTEGILDQKTQKWACWQVMLVSDWHSLSVHEAVSAKKDVCFGTVKGESGVEVTDMRSLKLVRSVG